VTSASAHDGAQLRNVAAKDNTASSVWANSAYRSKSNEGWLENNGLKSDIHQRKPKDKPMPEATLWANGRRSKIRSAVKHAFVRQKDQMKLFIRTIGIKRAIVKIGMANIAYSMLRYVFHEGNAPSRTSGRSYWTTGSQTVSSNPMKTSSTTAATLGGLCGTDHGTLS